MTSSAPSLILGTAGHIDHGKSSLVKALTDTDPDRLAEEKERGITIELGFARLDLPNGSSLGVVDVPGHERFVRQMIAGSSGIDIALLCIAADDGVMPQTIEHIAVLELLGIDTCVVALTKCDLVDEDWLGFMTEEIRVFLECTAFADAAIVPVSSRTGAGLPALLEAVQDASARARKLESGGALRMPIDRAFTIKGAGTVVTGTLWRGSVAIDDELAVLPSNARARVRSIQEHGASVDVALPGNRVALNIANLKKDDVRPGDFLATPGTLAVSDRFDAHFVYLDTAKTGKPLKSGAWVHVAHGTKEVIGRILFFDGREQIKPGERTYAQFRLEEPLPVSRSDRYIVRSYSPTRVIGGGTVLIAAPRRRTNLSDAERTMLDALMQNDDEAAVRAALALQQAPVKAADLVRLTGLDERDLSALLDRIAAAGELKRIGEAGAFYAADRIVRKHVSAIENHLMRFHAENPNLTGISKGALAKRCKLDLDSGCFDAVLHEAIAAKSAVLVGGEISHPKAGAGAQALIEQTADALLAALAAGGTTPPFGPELFEGTSADQSVAFKAMGLLEQRGAVRRIGKDLWFAADAYDVLKTAVTEHLAAHGSANAADLKDAMGVSRKFAIPVLEYFDANGITRRDGDMRTLP